MCTHILTAQSSILDDIDTWRGSNELAHESIDFDEVYRVYLKRIYEWSDTVKVHRRDSTAYLMDDWTQHKEYDFIYIDADHTAVSVLLDAELSWLLLKSGGIMAFDDYQWGQHLPASKSPKLGIDLFLERHAGEYELLESGLQVWIRKL
jgi:predicted O-methyltransferase YrrM